MIGYVTLGTNDLSAPPAFTISCLLNSTQSGAWKASG